MKKLNLPLFVMTVVVFAMSGCAKPTPASTETPSPGEANTAESSNAEIGKTIQSQRWEITLIDSPLMVEQVGSGTAKMRKYFDFGVREAEGIFLIVPVQLTNGADEMRMFTSKSSQLIVTDVHGREVSLAGAPVNMTVAYDDERWGEQENQLVQNPMEAGVTWEGPVVFDVPEDATGFRMSFQGSEDSVVLGP